MASRASLYTTAVGLAALLAAGCGKNDPPLYDVHGKVTLKGKPCERLTVHFRPLSGEVTPFNMGVGETDKNGVFKTVMSAGGNGLQAGEYKVVFTYMTTKSGKTAAAGEKLDDAGAGMVATEQVGKPYDIGTSLDDTPVRFTVKPGDNEFTFDIPTSAR